MKSEKQNRVSKILLDRKESLLDVGIDCDLKFMVIDDFSEEDVELGEPSGFSFGEFCKNIRY